MTAASRRAFAVASAVFLTVTVLAWRTVLRVDQPQVNGLWIVTFYGAGGMVLIGWWVSARGQSRR